MKKITLLGLLVFLCAAAARATHVPDWMTGQGVKPGEVTAGTEVIIRCPATDLGGAVYLQGTAVTGTVSEELVWVLEDAETEGFYLKLKSAASDEDSYVQTPANQNNTTKVTLGAKATAGVFTFATLSEADITKFNASNKLDGTYSPEYTGRLVVTATNGTQSAIRNGNAANGGTYAGTGGAEWTLWNLYKPSDAFTSYVNYVKFDGPTIDQYLLPAAEGVVGGFHAADLTSLNTLMSEGKWEEAQTALQALLDSDKKVAFDANKYYTLVSAQGAAAGAELAVFESYTTTNDGGAYALRWAAPQGVASMWKFVPAGTVTEDEAEVQQYKMQALNSGKFVPTVPFNVASYMTDEENAGIYELEDAIGAKNAASIAASFSIKDYNDERGDWAVLTAKVDGANTPDWTAENAEGFISTYKNESLGVNWYLRPVTAVSVTVPAGSQYATVNLPFAVQLPDGVVAYVGGSVSDTEISLSAIENHIVPAQCPVVLVAKEGTYDLTIAYGDETEAPANSLRGTLVPETVDADASAYIVTNGSAGVGFYKITDADNRTIPANKAYYAPAAETEAAVLSFSFGPATGIDGVTVADKAADTYYDLSGRRVLYPTHGVYVKGNGEKVYIK